MMNGISNAITSPLEDLSPVSDSLSNLPQGFSGEDQAAGANGNSNLESEIQNTLMALAQELQQLEQLISNLGGSQQGGDDSGQGGASGISSGGSASPGASTQSLLAAGPEGGASGPSGAPQSGAGAPAASAGASGAAAPGGALGPNVPSALQPYTQEINAAAKQTGVPASLIGAQILQESSGNPNAVTTNPALGKPDMGLMQVDQDTFQGLQQQYPNLLGGKSAFDPGANIMAGALYDAQMLKQNNGDIGAALTAYNGNADSNYVNEVTAKMNALQNGTPVPGGFS